MTARWARLIFWLDDNLNHRRVTTKELFGGKASRGRAAADGTPTVAAHTRWRWFCDYNDYLTTGEWPR
jgi:hypothetical protein